MSWQKLNIIYETIEIYNKYFIRWRAIYVTSLSDKLENNGKKTEKFEFINYKVQTYPLPYIQLQKNETHRFKIYGPITAWVPKIFKLQKTL